MSAYADARRVGYIRKAPATSVVNDVPAQPASRTIVSSTRGTLREQARIWRKAVWHKPYPTITLALISAVLCELVVAHLLSAASLPSAWFSWWHALAWLAALLTVLLAASVDAVYRLTVKINEIQSAVLVKGQLKLRARVQKVTTFGYYDKAFGGGCKDDRELTVDVYLTPTKPMTLDVLALDMWGKRFSAEDLPVRAIKTETSYSIVLKLPRQFVVDTDNARVFARADGGEWYSEPFSVDFGVQQSAA